MTGRVKLLIAAIAFIVLLAGLWAFGKNVVDAFTGFHFAVEHALIALWVPTFIVACIAIELSSPYGDGGWYMLGISIVWGIVLASIWFIGSLAVGFWIGVIVTVCISMWIHDRNVSELERKNKDHLARLKGQHAQDVSHARWQAIRETTEQLGGRTSRY
jgi:hypothetical protein